MNVKLKKWVLKIPFIFIFVLFTSTSYFFITRNNAESVLQRKSIYLYFIALIIALFSLKLKRVKYVESKKYYLSLIEIIYLLIMILINQSLGQSTPYNNVEIDNSFYLILLETVILAPLLEELFFRGFIFNKIEHVTNKYFALIISALSFSLSHAEYNLETQVKIIIAGLYLGLIYIRSRNILIQIIAHSLNNFLVTLLKYNILNKDLSKILFIFTVTAFVILIFYYKKCLKKPNSENYSKEYITNDIDIEKKISPKNRKFNLQKITNELNNTQFTIKDLNENKEISINSFNDKSFELVEKKDLAENLDSTIESNTISSKGNFKLFTYLNYVIAILTIFALITPFINNGKLLGDKSKYVLLSKENMETKKIEREQIKEKYNIFSEFDSSKLVKYDGYFDSNNAFKITVFDTLGNFKIYTINKDNIILIGSKTFKNKKKDINIYDVITTIYSNDKLGKLNDLIVLDNGNKISRNIINNIYFMKTKNSVAKDITDYDVQMRVRHLLSGKLYKKVEQLDFNDFIYIYYFMKLDDSFIRVDYFIDSKGNIQMNFNGIQIGPYQYQYGEKIYSDLVNIYNLSAPK